MGDYNNKKKTKVRVQPALIIGVREGSIEMVDICLCLNGRRITVRATLSLVHVQRCREHNLEHTKGSHCSAGRAGFSNKTTTSAG